MATTSNRRIGKIRIKLARILGNSIPGFSIDPVDLSSQIPVYASRHRDCCSWFGDGTIDVNVDGTIIKAPCHVYSYDTMRECLRGIEASPDGFHEFEISAVANSHGAGATKSR